MNTILPGWSPLPAWIFLFLITVPVMLVLGTLLHEIIHLLTAIVLGADIHGFRLTPEGSLWRFVLGDIQLEFDSSTRVSRTVAMAPTITAAVSLAVTRVLVESVVVFALLAAFLAVIGVPSRQDLEVLTA